MGVRSLGFERVFLDGDVVFSFGDPHYHLRLALYALTDFPRYLTWDPYLNFPHGAVVPWPPLYDLWVAGSAALVGGSVQALERVAAWWPPLLGAVASLGVLAAGRAAAGPGPGLGAAALYALIPASTAFSSVGNADHHAAVAALCALWLALQTRILARPPGRRAAVATCTAALAAVRAALVLTWAGSLAVVGIADPILVAVAAGLRKRGLLAVQAASLVLSAAVVLPFAFAGHARAGGETGAAATPLSAEILSPLQPLVCVALATWTMGVWLWLRTRSEPPGRAGVIRRLVKAGTVGGVVAGGLLLQPGVRAGLAGGGGFVAGTSEAYALWAATNVEQAPLWQGGAGSWGRSLLGWFAYAVPFVPIGVAWLAWRRSGADATARPAAPVGRRDDGPQPTWPDRSPASGALWTVAGWSAGFGALAMVQARFANEWSPAGCVALSVVLAAVGAWLARALRLPWTLRAGPALVLTAALLWPALVRHHGRHLPGTLAHLSGLATAPARLSPEASMVRFAQAIRAATPETSGFLDPEVRPEYAILSDPSLGHALHYVARRPTPSDNFGPLYGATNLLETLRLLLTPPDASTPARLRELGVRYVLTSWQPHWHAQSLMEALHGEDGRAADRTPALSHFRLVLEGPENGLPLTALFAPVPRRPIVSYKLFRLVEGAVLEVPAEPGSRVRAQVTVEASGGRRFVHRSRAVADERGVARLRVPYPTDGRHPVRAAGPYRIHAGEDELRAWVAERDVLEGRTVRPEGARTGPGARPGGERSRG